MSCPTCSHTMARIADGRTTVWHCDRCGTVKTEPGMGPPEYYVPKLVERIRRFRDLAENGHGLSAASANLWHRLGIAESINTPEKR
jgi:hypothetical protein